MKFSFLINILIAVLVTLISESFYRNFLSNVTSMVHVGSFASRSQVSLPADELCILVTVEIMELNIITLGELNLFWETWLSSFITGYHSNNHLELQSCVLNTGCGEGLFFFYISWENSHISQDSSLWGSFIMWISHSVRKQVWFQNGVRE